MEKQVLLDEKTFPDIAIIQGVLTKDQFELYLKFTEAVDQHGLVIEWRFYRDTKSWLGKILNGKKNLGWLSMWDDGFRVTVYFPERFVDDLRNLKIKNLDKKIKPAGKSRAVITNVEDETAMNDAMKLLEYKATIK